MSIEKMKLLGIKGNSRDLDRFLANVLFNSDVQIEDAKKIYNKGWKLEYFEYDYKIKETLKRCETILNKLNIQYTKDTDMVRLESKVEDISRKIEEMDLNYESCKKIIETNKKLNDDALTKIQDASRIENIDIDMQKLYNLQYIKFRYGIQDSKRLLSSSFCHGTIMSEIPVISFTSFLPYLFIF